MVMINTQAMARSFHKAENDRKRRGNRLLESNSLLRDVKKAFSEGDLSPNEFSLRRLFEDFVPDGRELVRGFDPRIEKPMSLVEAGDSVDTAAFANITGQIVFSTVLQAFNDASMLSSQVARTIPTQFSGERIPGISRVGDKAELVPEGERFPTAGVSEEWLNTPQTKKRGMIVPVTKEAIFFDRTGILIQRASEVATWLGVNKEKRVLDAALGLSTLYRRNEGTAQATYGDTHTEGTFDNLSASNALADWENVEAAELLFDAMTDPNTGDPINVMPNTLIVPTALLHTARRIVSATELRHGSDPVTLSANTVGNYNILSSPFVKQRTSSATTWFIGNPMQAFAYMENWPITTIEAPSNSHDEFHFDIVRQWRVSERGAAAVLEPRYMVKSTA